MTKRRKGQIPYESSHPTRPDMPDVPGHEQKGGIVVNKEIKRELDRQIARLREEIVETSHGSESKG